MDDRDMDGTGAPPPKLTIGQRLLTALPNLERQKARPASPRRPIEPDSVVAADVDAPKSTPRPGRFSDALSRPPAGTQPARKPDPTADMSNEELTHAIKRIDDRERRYAFYAGPLGALIGIALTAVAIHNNPPLHHKLHEPLSLLVLEGLARVVLGGLVVVAAIYRRRSFVAFALLFLGTADVFPFALIFWGLGGWMLWRVFRYQKVLTARGAGPQRARATQAPRSAQTPRAPARSGAVDARERARARKEARERKKGKLPEPTGPPPSKRYTPPKPTRPRPPAPS